MSWFKQIIETPKKLFIVTEFIGGGELFGRIVKSKKLSEDVSWEYFQQILSAIEYMHVVGVAHRDLKPENLLLDERNKVKVVDFGLSNTFSFPDEKLKTACGSPCYASPEMIENKWYSPIKSDIWSAGIILFAMLCGHLPFDVLFFHLLSRS